MILAGISAASCGQKAEPEHRPEPTPQIQRVTDIPQFEGKGAFRFLKAQTDFGPRNPGSERHEKCLNFLAQSLQEYADAVNLQTFPHTGYEGEQYTMTNVIASFNPNATKRVMLCAHWDTRPVADMERDAAKRRLPIPGANDGASGVAVLLELARLFRQAPPPVGIDIVLFDGEDFGRSGDLDNYFLGARYFARHRPAAFNPRFAILLDMVGDKGLTLAREANSVHYAPATVKMIWDCARDLQLSQFVDEAGGAIEDDHIPLNEAGIPTVDIIDIDLVGGAALQPERKYWHTLRDTPDRCSPESLDAVGEVLVRLLYTKYPEF